MKLSLRRDQVLPLVLIAPAFLYLGLDLGVGYTGWDGASVLGFLLVPLFLVIGLFPPWGPVFEVFGYISVGVIATLGTATNALGSGGYDFAAGLLLASPFLLGSWAWTPRKTPAARIVGLGVGLLEGIILLAALASIRAQGLPETSYNLFGWYTQVNVLQVCGLSGVLNVAPSWCTSTTAFPLRDIVDPTFTLLAGIAFLGALVPALTPRTARMYVGSAESWEDFTPASQGRPGLALNPEMARGLARRTLPRTSPSLIPPGAAALLTTALICLVFVGVAINAPDMVLAPTLFLLLATLAVVLLLNRSGREARSLRRVALPTAARVVRNVRAPPAALPAPVPAPPSLDRAPLPGGVVLP